MLYYPVPIHPDGRLPEVSNPWGLKPKGAYAHFGGLHTGADIMYRAGPHDPPYAKGSPFRSKRYYMPDGVPCLAVNDGVVTAAGLDKGPRRTGYAVRICHDQRSGFSTVYCHLADLLVAKGESVTAGEIIGHIGRSQVPGALNHLHLEVWPYGRVSSRVDPGPFLLHYTRVRLAT